MSKIELIEKTLNNIQQLPENELKESSIVAIKEDKSTPKPDIKTEAKLKSAAAMRRKSARIIPPTPLPR